MAVLPVARHAFSHAGSCGTRAFRRPACEEDFRRPVAAPWAHASTRLAAQSAWCDLCCRAAHPRASCHRARVRMSLAGPLAASVAGVRARAPTLACAFVGTPPGGRARTRPGGHGRARGARAHGSRNRACPHELVARGARMNEHVARAFRRPRSGGHQDYVAPEPFAGARGVGWADEAAGAWCRRRQSRFRDQAGPRGVHAPSAHARVSAPSSLPAARAMGPHSHRASVPRCGVVLAHGPDAAA